MADEDTVVEGAEAPVSVKTAEIERLIAKHGTLYSAEGHEPFLISGEDKAWWINKGHMDIFAVQVEDGRPAGVREHFVSMPEGSLMLSIDFKAFGLQHGFLAVGSTGCQVYEFDMQELVAKEDVTVFGAGLAAKIELWLLNVSEALTRDHPSRPKPDNLVKAGEEFELEKRSIVSTRTELAWLMAQSGDLFLSTEELFFEGDRGAFPMAPATWVEVFEEGDYSAVDTESVLISGEIWSGLHLFHLAVCQAEFINKRLLSVDEFHRLKTKAEYKEAAREAALAEIASVLNPDYAELRDARSAGGEGDPLFAAARLVGAEQGIEILSHPDAKLQADMDTRLGAFAKASRIRVRNIALRETWWTMDSGPFLAFWEDSGEPVAVIPSSPRSYYIVDGKTGERQNVNAAVAQQLHSIGKTLYRRFPDGLLSAWRLLKYGTRGLGGEFRTIVMMGIALGMLGLVTPYLTGLIFDDVIPGAEQGQLMQMAMGLVFTALGIAAFEATRAVAVLRIEGKMDYSVQSAIWDRLLSLPMGFFRKFSAGDLSNRAYGIDKIRELVSGVGVTAVLGSTTSMFYLILLFKYNLQLAFLGIGLVIFAMVFTVTMNIWQLSHQRKLYGIIGKITSTVLQFISGVAKIRIAGAEDHAFKVWARQFADQRRISFVVGRITNALQVFTGGFPVVCSLLIFLVLVSVQKEAVASGQPLPISTGEFVAFNSAFGTFLSSMLQLSMASLSIFQMIPVYERFKPILAEKPEFDEAKSYPGELKGEIELFHVNFRYTEDGPLILKNVSITIKPGQFVAFVGPSGSGKSTILRVLLGFETPESGKTYFDGQDLSSLDIREVRQQIGVVLQTSRLMPTDIYRNIISNNTALSIEDAWEAAAAAGLDEDIKKMPMQMHTVVSEGGGGFSGGQKQRLMVARALVNKPRMLFLDEATSALDNRTQNIVTQSMDRLQATRIVVAHRLSTIANADCIYVLVAGKVEESGNYEELMALDGHFAELAKRQIV